MFYNTGIGTYVWIVTNRKEKRRKGKIQLLDARGFCTAGGSEESKRSLGDKRRHITANQIEEIVRLCGRYVTNDLSKIFDNADFGYTRVTVERPLRLRFDLSQSSLALLFKDKEVEKLGEGRGTELSEILGGLSGYAPFLDDARFLSALADRLSFRISKGLLRSVRAILGVTDVLAEPARDLNPDDLPLTDFEALADWDILSDPALRDFENVPLKEDIDDYFRRQVAPHVPDAWMDRSKDKVGYEINFNRHFYRYTPPRPLEEIDADLKKAEEEFVRLLREVTA
jgi:type I restriction enzyme M protein